MTDLEKIKGHLNIDADWLLARVRDNEEGCLIWTRYSQDGNPRANFADAIPKNVRRVVWESLTGKEPRKGTIIKTCCGTLNCVEPSHLVQRPASTRTKGRKQTVVHRAAMAKALRAKSKISGVIDEIRNSDLSQTEEAKRHGISQSMVSKIKLGKSWQDYSSPFAGLGGRGV